MRSTILFALLVGGCSNAPPDVPAPAAVPDLCGDSPGCFVRVDGATVTLGGIGPLDGPVRERNVAAFLLQAREVSVAAYTECSRAGPCTPISGRDDDPACMTWDDAQRYCASIGHRLPTEEEWELAARGPEGRRFPWGQQPRCVPVDPNLMPQLQREADRARRTCAAIASGAESTRDPHLASQCVDPQLHDPAEMVARVRVHLGQPPLVPEHCVNTGPVSVYAHPGFPQSGPLHWMAGNVAEWTSTPAPDNPAFRIYKGGGFLSMDAAELGSAVRAVGPTDLLFADVGVRCAADL